MGTPFKERLDAAAVDRIAAAVAAADGRFDAGAFTARARAGLDRLELRDRVRHIAAALREALPEDFAAASATIVAAARAGDLSGFEAWPLVQVIEDHGVSAPEASFAAMHTLTARCSCEFAVRPFLEADTTSTLEVLHAWARDPDEHVRRLVSEGTRPRLPWGRRLERFRQDPAPVLSLLDLLFADESETVRRSVANSLNDISKDHPATAVATARRWLSEGCPSTPALVRRGLRTLVKSGDGDALRLVGVNPDIDVSVRNLRIEDRARVGHDFTFTCTLVSRERGPAAIEVDYVLHRTVADGSTSPKVWKLTRGSLAPGATLQVRKRHSLRQTSVRTWRPGTYRIEVQVNGRVLAGVDFQVAP